jgi:hypothetical protein
VNVFHIKVFLIVFEKLFKSICILSNFNKKGLLKFF